MANTPENADNPCIVCGGEADRVRSTQFERDHYFCEADARLEMDFNEPDPNYVIWSLLDPIEQDRQRLASEFTD